MTTLRNARGLMAGLIAWSAATPARAQNPVVVPPTGTVGGFVRDRTTNAPLEGAMVFVQGTNYGAYTKANGAYTILGLPVGTYTIAVNRAGYQVMEIENVIVRADVRRPLDVEITERAVVDQADTVAIAARSGRIMSVQAQSVPCAFGPGVRLGIVAFQSSSWGFRLEGTRQIYSFQAEPIVIEVAPWSALRAGDVVEAVNGEPITTRAGADAFVNAPVNESSRVQVRRGGDRVELESQACSRFPVIEQGQVGGGAGGRGRGGRGGGVMTGAASGGAGAFGGVAAGGTMTGGAVASTGPARPPQQDTTRTGAAASMMARAQSLQRAVDTLRASMRVPADITRDSLTGVVQLNPDGFVLRCVRACARTMSRDGNPYWRFSASPQVSYSGSGVTRSMREAGVQATDYVTKVNGHDVTTEEAGVLLTHVSLVLPLELEITRNGERRKVTLKKRE